MKYYTIYKTTNKVNDKIYIGQHITDDLNDNYLGSGKIIKSAIDKYGSDNFEKEILFVFETYEEMNLKEVEIVTEDFIKRKDTYNLKIGGTGNWWYVNTTRTEDEQKRLSVLGGKVSGKRHAELLKNDSDYRKAHINRFTKATAGVYKSRFAGKKHLEKSKQKIGQANSVYQKGEKNSQYGTCWIHNLNKKINKKIKKDDLDEWLENGWQQGRKMKF